MGFTASGQEKLRKKNPKTPSPEKWWLRQQRDRTGRSPPGTTYSPAEPPAISAGHKGFCEPWSYLMASSPAQPEFNHPKRVFSRRGIRESKAFTSPLSEHPSPREMKGWEQWGESGRAHRGALQRVLTRVSPFWAIPHSAASISNHCKHSSLSSPTSFLLTPKARPCRAWGGRKGAFPHLIKPR